MKRKRIGDRLISRPVVTPVANTGARSLAPIAQSTIAPDDAESDPLHRPRCPEALSFASWQPAATAGMPPVSGFVETLQDDREAALV
jgi:hypothetical protein